MGKLYTFLRNIKFLFTSDIRNEFRESQYNTMLNVEDYCNFEMSENMLEASQRLNIYNYDETLNVITETPKSFCRFGDGEINLIKGKSISFQDYDERLARIMLEILKDDNTDFYVGINYNYFHSTRMLNPYNRKFYLMDISPFRKFLLEHCNKNRTYIAAGFNQLYMFYDNYDFEAYYARIKALFRNKKLVIFAGKGILQNLNYDVFEMCDSRVVVEGPTENAFSDFDNLLEKARSFDKNNILCFILGPTSKALVYYLTKEGYTAWDIGHMAKDYNMFMEKKEKNSATIVEFYSKD